MPIYMKVDGVRGNITAEGSAGANGGVWKTTNFLTNDPDASAGGNTMQISRISLIGGANAVEGRDASAKFKIEQLMNAARPDGKLYVATDAGVYQSAGRFDGQGRLLLGTESGVWRSGKIREAAANMKASNNLKQLGLGCHNAAVEIIVTDTQGTVVSTHRLSRVSISESTGGTFTLTFNGQTAGGY